MTHPLERVPNAGGSERVEAVREEVRVVLEPVGRLGDGRDELADMRAHLAERTDCSRAAAAALEVRVGAVDDVLELGVHFATDERALVGARNCRVCWEEHEHLLRQTRVRGRLRVGKLDGGADELDELAARRRRIDRVGEDHERAGLRPFDAKDDGVLDVRRLAAERELDRDGVDLLSRHLQAQDVSTVSRREQGKVGERRRRTSTRVSSTRPTNL